MDELLTVCDTLSRTGGCNMGDGADMALEGYYAYDDIAWSDAAQQGGYCGYLYDDETGEFTPGPFLREPKPCGQGPCPECGGPTHSVVGRHGPFYGCNAFPKCKGSRNCV